LVERTAFDAGASTRSFRLAMTDYAELLLLGPLLHNIEQTAPNVQVAVRRPERIFLPPEESLRDGTLDAAIGFFPEESGLEPGTRSQELFVEGNVCIARRGHPLFARPFTLRRFAAAKHVAILYRPEMRGFIDDILAGPGLRRRLQAATPHFLVIPYAVAQSELIAVVPAGLAARFRKILPIDVRKVPLRMPQFRMRLLWHERNTNDPA